MENIFSPPTGTFRTIFLYVGQGEATLFIVPDGDSHIYALVDSNRDIEKNGIDLPKLFQKYIPQGKLVFINTHPHTDHIRGVQEIHEAVGIAEVWHSGHTPSKKFGEGYEELQKVVKDIGNEHEYFLRGSREANTLHKDREETSKIIHQLGDITYQIFSPAEYVCDEIDNEDAEVRRARIHEQCGVIRFEYMDKSILITGDSDKAAWQNHITEYHGENLASTILSASHHGSRTFFKNGKEDENPYEEHIQKIAPEYLVISAPKQADSQHDHPHDDALELYGKYVEAENIYHLGDHDGSTVSLIVDIDADGSLALEVDSSLVSDFQSEEGDKDSDEKSTSGVIYTARPKSKPYLA